MENAAQAFERDQRNSDETAQIAELERMVGKLTMQIELFDYLNYHNVYRHIGRFLDEVYMQKRIHSSLGYLTPAEFESEWLAQQYVKELCS